MTAVLNAVLIEDWTNELGQAVPIERRLPLPAALARVKDLCLAELDANGPDASARALADHVRHLNAAYPGWERTAAQLGILA